ncbi:histidine kinase dimerization/phosphoacceptor domain -containing protein [Sphingomonas oligophenolica]|uniref:histidine kinase n=1 Tax=Sphingomonas oligophenolica TaxID=301154 RepID=A0ABU9Y0I7_9SPHN
MTEQTHIHPEAAGSLALAVIASSRTPLLLLDGDLTVISASDSFCRDFEIDPADARGCKLAELGAGEWNGRQLNAMLKATVAGNTEIGGYEMDLKREGRPPRCVVLEAHKLDYADSGNVRIILSVLDITEARHAEKLKEALLREKAVLLKELQHRVANSLQIVASVLMLSARRVQSEETRIHLRDAHQRVMSIAAVQRHLAVSDLKDVRLRGYLTELCDSLAASMIHDHDQLSIVVQADFSITSAEESVSLGLIVTELVINALKHAFPMHRNGRIVVAYQATGPAWILSVADDGVGMHGGGVVKPGLGTGIIEALASQLDATVHTASSHPGTRISIVHA